MIKTYYIKIEDYQQADGHRTKATIQMQCADRDTPETIAGGLGDDEQTALVNAVKQMYGVKELD